MSLPVGLSARLLSPAGKVSLELEPMREKIAAALAQLTEAGALDCETLDEYELACSYRRRLNMLLADCDEERKARKAPYLEAGRAVDDVFMPLTKAGAEFMRRHIDPGIIGYERKDRERKEAAAAAARVEQERLTREALELMKKPDEASQDTADMVLAQAAQIDTTPAPLARTGDSGTRSNWKMRVVNFALLPDEYKLPNQSELDRLARASAGKITIPGCEAYDERVVQSRRG